MSRKKNIFVGGGLIVCTCCFWWILGGGWNIPLRVDDNFKNYIVIILVNGQDI